MWNPIKSPLIVRTTCLQSRHESWRRRVGPERKRGKRFLSVTPPHSHPQHTLSGWLSLCLFLCLRHKSFDHLIIKQSPRCKYCICVCAWERHRERERERSLTWNPECFLGSKRLSLAFHCLGNTFLSFKTRQSVTIAFLHMSAAKLIDLFISSCNSLLSFTAIYCHSPLQHHPALFKSPVMFCCPWEEDRSPWCGWQRLARTGPFLYLQPPPGSDTHPSDNSA